MKKILCILAHPLKDSLCGALHSAYLDKAKESGYDVSELVLSELNFDPILHNGYKIIQELEPDLIKAQEMIKTADHIVLTFPTWWGTFPALLKGFLDRVILPGFAFKFHKNKLTHDKLLKGKTARLIVTMDGPVAFYNYIIGSPGIKGIKKGVLEFVGISPVRVTLLDLVKFRTPKNLGTTIEKVAKLGAKAA